MASTPQLIFPEGQLYRALVYTGSNSADLNSLISDFTILSEGGGSLTFQSGGTNRTVPSNGYVVYRQGVVQNVFTNEDDFLDTYGTLPTVGSLEHYHEIVLSTGPGIPGDGDE